ncbi:MAG: DinB family protein [Anaerolineae bacterium]|jgi:uncharacterized damage-inducible protein DinB
MTHPDAETLIQSFHTTWRIMQMQTNGLSHADSLLQPPFRGNCLNWVLGHILVGRDQALRLLGEASVLVADEAARYRTGSEPVQEEEALSLERLLAGLAEAQERLDAALARAPAGALAAVVDFRGREQPLGQALDGLHWHETYHTGQLELLRQLAGTDDAII